MGLHFLRILFLCVSVRRLEANCSLQVERVLSAPDSQAAMEQRGSAFAKSDSLESVLDATRSGITSGTS